MARTSLFKANSRYGIEIAKLIPALLHVTHWNLKAQLQYKDSYTGTIKKQQFNLEDNCGLVSHYSPGKPYDSMLEESFAKRWLQLKTEWQLEREVDLVPLPGGVMIPDFRLVHPDGRVFSSKLLVIGDQNTYKRNFYRLNRPKQII
jgi:predicted nuclease of restriction endonuclease-like RecB superfamily